jgi:hypothetical protein
MARHSEIIRPAARLPQAVSQIDMTKWPAPILRMFLGQVTPRPFWSLPTIQTPGQKKVSARRLPIVVACHRPPRAFASPRAFNDSAMARSEVVPALCISRMIGNTFAP